MNWTWNVRSNDGAMNGLEFARCTTAGGTVWGGVRGKAVVVAG